MIYGQYIYTCDICQRVKFDQWQHPRGGEPLRPGPPEGWRYADWRLACEAHVVETIIDGKPDPDRAARPPDIVPPLIVPFSPPLDEQLLEVERIASERDLLMDLDLFTDDPDEAAYWRAVWRGLRRRMEAP